MKKKLGSKIGKHHACHKSDLTFSIFFCAAGVGILVLLLTLS